MVSNNCLNQREALSLHTYLTELLTLRNCWNVNYYYHSLHDLVALKFRLQTDAQNLQAEAWVLTQAFTPLTL